MSHQSGQGMRSRGKKSNLLTYVMLGLSLGAMTFFGVCTPQGYNGGLSGDAAKVEGETIFSQDFARAYRQASENLRRQDAENYDPAKSKLAAKVLDTLIRDRIMFLEAVKLGLKATDDEIVDVLVDFEIFHDESGHFSEKQFRDWLRSSQYTEASFQEEIRRYLTNRRFRQMVYQANFTSEKAATMEHRISGSRLTVEFLRLRSDADDINVSEDEKVTFFAKEGADERIRAWYESHQQDFSTEEKVKARHILIAFDGARNASAKAAGRSREAAAKQAELVLQQLRSGKESFAALAKKISDEPSAAKTGGDLGFFGRQSMVKEFSDAAFALKKGDISGVVESPFGFHIIKVEDKQEARETSLEDAKSGIAGTLIRQEKGPEIAAARGAEILERLKKGEDIEELLRQYQLKWEKSEDLSYMAAYFPGLGFQPEIRQVVYSLTKEKPLHEEVVRSGQNYFILKLADLREADTAELTEEKLQQIAMSRNLSRGQVLFDQYQQDFVKQYRDRSAVYENPAYLELDRSEAEE